MGPCTHKFLPLLSHVQFPFRNLLVGLSLFLKIVNSDWGLGKDFGTGTGVWTNTVVLGFRLRAAGHLFGFGPGMAWKRHGVLLRCTACYRGWMRQKCPQGHPVPHEDPLSCCSITGKSYRCANHRGNHRQGQWSQDKFSSEFIHSDPNAANIHLLMLLQNL